MFKSGTYRQLLGISVAILGLGERWGVLAGRALRDQQWREDPNTRRS